MTESQKFTVFAKWLDTRLDNCYFTAGYMRPVGLQECIDSVAAEGKWDPVAWAPEVVDAHGGDKKWDTLRAESVAAGRVIERTPDGRFIPRGIPTEEAKSGEKAKSWEEAKARFYDAMSYSAPLKPTTPAALKAEALMWFDPSDQTPAEIAGEPIPTFYVAAPLKTTAIEATWIGMDYAKEEPRPPLPNQSAGRFNNFKGWPIVTSSSQPDYHDKRHTLQQSPDLERHGHQVRPGFALAAVRQLDR